jgi:hypothetical protein
VLPHLAEDELDDPSEPAPALGPPAGRSRPKRAKADAGRPSRVPGAPGVRRRPPVAAQEESILTARELAAAFQLDFKPPGSAKASKPAGFGKIFTSCC